MERSEVRRALYEIVAIRKDLQEVSDYLPTYEIIHAICECYRIEEALRFALNYDATMAMRQVRERRRADLQRACTYEEFEEIRAKYKNHLHYKRSY